MNGDQKKYNQELREEILSCLSKDQYGLRKRLNQLFSKKDNADQLRDIELLRSKITESISKVSNRKSRIPNILFSENLRLLRGEKRYNV